MFQKVAIISVVVLCTVGLWRIIKLLPWPFTSSTKSFIDDKTVSAAKVYAAPGSQWTQTVTPQSTYFQPDCGTQWIEIQSAIYGNNLRCKKPASHCYDCYKNSWEESMNVQSKIKQLCEPRKSSCSVHISDGQFRHNPSEGCPKATKIFWRCKAPPSKAPTRVPTRKPTPRPTPKPTKKPTQPLRDSIADEMTPIFHEIDADKNGIITIEQIKAYSLFQGLESRIQDHFGKCNTHGKTGFDVRDFIDCMATLN